MGVSGKCVRAAAWLSALLATACASSGPRPATEPLELGNCPYRQVWVEQKNTFSGDGGAVAELARQRVLQQAIGWLPRLGFTLTRTRPEAYWKFHAGGWIDDAGRKNVTLGLKPELKLSRHLFLFVMDDPEFPYRGEMGTGWRIWFTGPAAEQQRAVEDAMRNIVANEAEQLTALCEAEARLVDEGWAEVEELRKELVRQMKEIRLRRAEETQRKRLELDVQRERRP